MEFYIRVVNEPTYQREKQGKIAASTLRLGSICVARQIDNNLSGDDYAADAFVRIDKLEAPDDKGHQVMGLTVINVWDGKDALRDGQPLYGEGILDQDGTMYSPDGTTEDGYFPGVNNPYDPPRLEKVRDLDLKAPSSPVSV